jgi:glycerate 2-kinase
MLFKTMEKIIANGQTPQLKTLRKDVLNILTAAVTAVDPYQAVKEYWTKHSSSDTIGLDLSRFKHIYLVGFGKASVGMAQAICDIHPVDKGVVITNDTHHQVQHEQVSTMVGGHPLPTRGSVKGTQKLLELVDIVQDQDLMIVLISGGGSALLCNPRVTLSDMQCTTDLLLKVGAEIQEINTIRKHLSMVKGGQLAQRAKGTMMTLVISDVVGDPLEFIASGPTVPDSTTFDDAWEILQKYDLLEQIPDAVRCILRDGCKGKIPETPKPGDPVFTKVQTTIVANNQKACDAAQQQAKLLGYHPVLVTTTLTGEARNMGISLVKKAHSQGGKDQHFAFLAGGETTVTIRGEGHGGRNQEMVLASLEQLAGTDLVFASFATDGLDGVTDAAGAIADGKSLQRAQSYKLDYRRFLQENDSFTFFKQMDDLLLTGPTGTNVMDIQLLLR